MRSRQKCYSVQSKSHQSMKWQNWSTGFASIPDTQPWQDNREWTKVKSYQTLSTLENWEQWVALKAKVTHWNLKNNPALQSEIKQVQLYRLYLPSWPVCLLILEQPHGQEAVADHMWGARKESLGVLIHLTTASSSYFPWGCRTLALSLLLFPFFGCIL